MKSFRPKRWTYSGKPAGSDLDKVRFLVGDIDPDDKQLDDCEIEWLLEENGNPLSAAICAALGLAALYTRLYDNRAYGSQGSIAQRYIDLAKELNRKRARRGVAAYAGGISTVDKASRAADSSTVRPEFTRDMMKSVFSTAGISPWWET